MDFNISFATHQVCDLKQLSSSLRLSFPNFKMRIQRFTCKFGVENKNMTLYVWCGEYEHCLASLVYYMEYSLADDR